jgi:hypothetical protein
VNHQPQQQAQLTAAMPTLTQFLDAIYGHTHEIQDSIFDPITGLSTDWNRVREHYLATLPLLGSLLYRMAVCLHTPDHAFPTTPFFPTEPIPMAEIPNALAAIHAGIDDCAAALAADTTTGAIDWAKFITNFSTLLTTLAPVIISLITAFTAENEKKAE